MSTALLNVLIPVLVEIIVNQKVDICEQNWHTDCARFPKVVKLFIT